MERHRVRKRGREPRESPRWGGPIKDAAEVDTHQFWKSDAGIPLGEGDAPGRWDAEIEARGAEGAREKSFTDEAARDAIVRGSR